MDTDVSLDEVQNKLSAWGHFVTAVTLVTFSSLNASANVRKGFKQKNIYPRSMGIWNGMGGIADANVTAVGGKIFGCVDYSAVMGGGGTSPSRGVGVRQGRVMPHHHATPTVYTRHVYTHHTQRMAYTYPMIVDGVTPCAIVMSHVSH